MGEIAGQCEAQDSDLPPWDLRRLLRVHGFDRCMGYRMEELPEEYRPLLAKVIVERLRERPVRLGIEDLRSIRRKPTRHPEDE